MITNSTEITYSNIPECTAKCKPIAQTLSPLQKSDMKKEKGKGSEDLRLVTYRQMCMLHILGLSLGVSHAMWFI